MELFLMMVGCGLILCVLMFFQRQKQNRDKVEWTDESFNRAMEIISRRETKCEDENITKTNTDTTVENIMSIVKRNELIAEIDEQRKELMVLKMTMSDLENSHSLTQARSEALSALMLNTESNLIMTEDKLKTILNADSKLNPNNTCAYFFRGLVRFYEQDSLYTKYGVEANGIIINVHNAVHIRLIENQLGKFPDSFEIIAPIEAVEVPYGVIPENYIHYLPASEYLRLRMIYHGV